MARILRIAQSPLAPIGKLEVSDELLALEPHVRRATPDFAYENGGVLLKSFLDRAWQAGYVRDNSLVMCHPTEFVPYRWPKAPRWHVDFPPGLEITSDDIFVQGLHGNTGLIVCGFDTVTHPFDLGTLFVQGGEISLDLDQRRPDQEYVPGQFHKDGADSGVLYWWHPLIEQQLRESANLAAVNLMPNAIYPYTSSHFHQAPMMFSPNGVPVGLGNGVRAIMRINNPTSTEIQSMPTNTIFAAHDPASPRYVFRRENERWFRERYLPTRTEAALDRAASYHFES